MTWQERIDGLLAPRITGGSENVRTTRTQTADVLVFAELVPLLADVAKTAEAQEGTQKEALRWADQFLARHDAFLQHQTPPNAYAMKDAADGLRAALDAVRESETTTDSALDRLREWGGRKCPYCEIEEEENDRSPA